MPKPLNKVALDDPALSEGPNKVVFWSYPIIRNGLIYAIDIRNCLYVLRYAGSHTDEVAGINFLEGNSNLGDAIRLATPIRPRPNPGGGGLNRPTALQQRSQANTAGGHPCACG